MSRNERVVLHHHAATRQDGVDLAIDHPAFPCAVVHVHVVLVVDGKAVTDGHQLREWIRASDQGLSQRWTIERAGCNKFCK